MKSIVITQGEEPQTEQNFEVVEIDALKRSARKMQWAEY